MAIKVRKRGEGDESPEDDDQQEQTPDVDPAASDPFQRGSFRALTWLAENQGTVAGAVALLVVGAVAAYFVNDYMHRQAVKASSGVTRAVAAMEKPVDGSPTLEMMSVEELQNFSTVPEDTHPSEEARWNAVYDSAGETLNEHGDSAPAQSARLVRAAAALRIDKFEEAEKLYRAYLDGAASADSVPMAYYGLSVARAEQGKYEKAVAALDNLGGNYEGFALYHKGIYMEEAGKTKKAKDFYHKVLDMDAKSPYETDIKRRLALL